MKKFVVLLLIVLIGCSNSEKQKQETKKKENNKMKVEEIKDLKENEFVKATMQTNLGNIEIELFANKTPKTVENFAGLALKDYYDGVTFHRVIPEFMIQGGDPTGTGSGGQSIWGGVFEDEIVESLKHDSPGILSMANRGPNTNGSQFFITLVATPHLDGKHTVFGKVINGMDIVQKIGNVSTQPPFDKPVNDVVIENIAIEVVEK